MRCVIKRLRCNCADCGSLSFFLYSSVGADQNMKNDKGETPYDLAVKGGYEILVKKFAAALGQSQLEKMIRPKNKGY